MNPEARNLEIYRLFRDEAQRREDVRPGVLLVRVADKLGLEVAVVESALDELMNAREGLVQRLKAQA